MTGAARKNQLAPSGEPHRQKAILAYAALSSQSGPNCGTGRQDSTITGIR
jgi:hypothetical protein